MEYNGSEQQAVTSSKLVDTEDPSMERRDSPGRVQRQFCVDTVKPVDCQVKETLLDKADYKLQKSDN